MKLFLLGAISRAFQPGCKFEIMLCLVGGQGAGKSTFFRLLAVRDEDVYKRQVHYIILRASKEETLKRAVERSKLDRKTNIELVETMWEQFCNLGIYESNVIDTTTYSIQETVSAVQEKIASRAALLS